MSNEGSKSIPDAPEGYLSSLEDGKYLPPIHRIIMPETRTQSAKIRWLHALGYKTKDIAAALCVRYQQARNIITTEPKRAAREDLPELVIHLAEMEDIVDVLLGGELERTFSEDRKATKKAERAAQRAANHVEEDEVDEITEMEELVDFGSMIDEEDDDDAG